MDVEDWLSVFLCQYGNISWCHYYYMLNMFVLDFIQEGVGDTPDSYAYDGSRLRKWNVRTYKYGEVSF